MALRRSYKKASIPINPCEVKIQKAAKSIWKNTTVQVQDRSNQRNGWSEKLTGVYHVKKYAL